ncbi:MAG: bifunctional demethylmenaquinone methyltransferase/2-methoxy-6-polyprenyl-1,4-benzoquinol methylase UbiE [Planctomycetota bacterium]
MAPQSKIQNPKSKIGADTLLSKQPPLIRWMFSSIAGRYDFLNHLLSFGLDLWWRAKTVQWSGAGQGDRILDLCCGTGDLALAFRRRGRGGEVVGADFARPMLALARRKGGSGAARWVQADALMLPFRDESFDVTAVAFGVRNFGSLPRGLAEICRVVRRGGKVVVLEFSRPSLPVFRGLYGMYIGRILPRIAGVFFRGRIGAYEYLPRSIVGFVDAEELAEAMRRAGLAGVVVHRLTLGIVSVCTGIKT